MSKSGIGKDGWPSEETVLNHRDQEITRLAAELEQAREQRNYFEGAWDRAIEAGTEFRKRAEAAEQQVVALVDSVEKLYELASEVLYANEPVAPNSWYKQTSMVYGTILRKLHEEALSTIPDRAKKIQAVISAYDKYHRRFQNPLAEDGCYCTYCQAIRDLES